MRELRTIMLWIMVSSIPAACTSTTAIPTPLPTQTVPGQSPLVTPISVEATAAVRIGYITFPYWAADAGNFALQAGETITLVWEEAPPGASRYEFIFLPDAPAAFTFIGTDEDASDGATAQWLVPQDLNGSFKGTAYFPDGHTIAAGPSGAIYSGKLPPDGICALSSGGAGPIDLLTEPSSDATPFAFLLPGSYAEVLQRTTDGWYLVDAREARDQITNLLTTGSGWISDQARIKFHGPCDEIPLVDG